MNPLCVAITAGAKDQELDKLIKTLGSSKGEQECLLAAKQRYVGQEVVVSGPNMWGQWLREGERGTILSYNQEWDAFYLKMNRDDRRLNYPPSSVKKYHAPWISQEHMQSCMVQGDTFILSGIEGFKDSPILCVVEEVNMKNAFDKLDHWIHSTGDRNAVPRFPDEG